MEQNYDFNIKFMVYHSKFVSDQKVEMENYLSKVMNRKNEDYKQLCDENTLYVVLTTSIIDTGRDFDFDYAIIEPSSVKSMIQSAGRVMRHRDNVISDTPNIFILNKPIKAFDQNKNRVCYPTYLGGYEQNGRVLDDKTQSTFFGSEEFVISSKYKLKADTTNFKKRLC